MAKKPAAGTPATAVLADQQVEHTLHPYDVSPDAPNYGALVAQTLGIEPSRVFKTLIAEVDGRLVVAVVPVTGDLDLKALAGAAGGKRAGLADRAAAERSSGYVRGGISPLGQRKRLPTVVDQDVTGANIARWSMFWWAIRGALAWSTVSQMSSSGWRSCSA